MSSSPCFFSSSFLRRIPFLLLDSKLLLMLSLLFFLLLLLLGLSLFFFGQFYVVPLPKACFRASICLRASMCGFFREVGFAAAGWSFSLISSFAWLLTAFSSPSVVLGSGGISLFSWPLDLVGFLAFTSWAIDCSFGISTGAGSLRIREFRFLQILIPSNRQSVWFSFCPFFTFSGVFSKLIFYLFNLTLSHTSRVQP